MRYTHPARPLVLMIGFLACAIACAETPPPNPASPVPADLLRTLHRRPYGAGWVVGDSAANSKLPVPVSMLPGQTPAGGLVLLRAGIQADDAKLIESATDVARGVAACLTPSGQIPALGHFGATAGGRDPARLVADRRATRAGVALLLSVVAQQKRDGAKPDERLVSAATRATTWLASQQSSIGGWTSAYPPDRPPRESARLLRLDTEEFRDSTLTLLLAGQVLDKPAWIQQARLSVDLLIKMQWQGIPALNGRGCWSGAYNGDGTPGVKFGEFPKVIDAVASRRSLETLLAFAVLTDVASDDSDEARAVKNAITTATRTLAKQRGADGTWEPTWDPKRGAWADTAPQVDQTIFATTEPAAQERPRPGTFGLPRVLDVAGAWTARQTGKPDAGPADAFDALPLNVTAMLTGLTDLPFGPDPADTKPAAILLDVSAFTSTVQAAWAKLGDAEE